MRRKDREIKDIEVMRKIIDESVVCWVGMARNNAPYIIPMNFGLKDRSIYLHSVAEGLKVDILKANSRVCIAFGHNIELLPSPIVCETSMKYQSVLVFGQAIFIESEDKKREALDIIVKHYYKGKGINKLEYSATSFKSVVIIKVQIKKMTGKCLN